MSRVRVRWVAVVASLALAVVTAVLNVVINVYSGLPNNPALDWLKSGNHALEVLAACVVLSAGSARWLMKGRSLTEVKLPATERADPIVIGAVPREAPSYRPQIEVADILWPLADHKPSVRVLCGQTGLGKTQAAAHAARIAIAKGYQYVIWIGPSSTAALWRSQIRDVVVDLSLASATNSQSEKERAFQNFLNSRKSDTLLIFDDPVDHEFLRELIPSTGTANVVITTNDPSLLALGTQTFIEPFDLEVGVQYILERVRTEDRVAAAELVTYFNGLPLALAQVAAAISLDNGDISKYLRRLSVVRPGQAMFTVQDEDPYGRSLSEAIELVLRRIISAADTPDSLHALRLCSIAYPVAVPALGFVRSSADNSDSSKGEASQTPHRVMELLTQLGLLIQDVQGDSYTIHSTLAVALIERSNAAMVMRTRIDGFMGFTKAQAEEKVLTQRAEEISRLNASYCLSLWRGAEHRALLQILRSAKARLAVEEMLTSSCLRIAQYGDWDEAAQLLQEAEPLFAALGGVHGLVTRAARAELLWRRGRPRRALELLAPDLVLDSPEDQLSAPHYYCTTVAEAFAHLGETTRAMLILERELVRPDLDSNERAACLRDLVDLALDGNDLSAAEAHLAALITEVTGSADDERTIYITSQQARLARRHGNLAEAVKLSKENFDRLRDLGSNLNLASLATDLSVNAHELGDHALALNTEAWAFMTKLSLVGPADPRTLTSELNIAMILLHVHQCREALRLAKNVLAWRLHESEATTKQIGITWEVLGDIYLGLRRPKAAIARYEEATAIYQALGILGESELTRLDRNIALALWLGGSFDKALVKIDALLVSVSEQSPGGARFLATQGMHANLHALNHPLRRPVARAAYFAGLFKPLRTGKLTHAIRVLGLARPG